MGSMTSSVRQRISISNNPPPSVKNNNNKSGSVESAPEESTIDEPLSNFALENILEESNEDEDEEGIFNMGYEEDKKENPAENREVPDETGSPSKTERPSSTTLLISPDGNDSMPKVV